MKTKKIIMKCLRTFGACIVVVVVVVFVIVDVACWHGARAYTWAARVSCVGHSLTLTRTPRVPID